VSQAQKRRALSLGVTVFENSPILAIRKFTHTTGGFRVLTPQGCLTAGKLVLAADAFAPVVPAIANRMTPGATYFVRTESLSEAQLATIGWSGREALEDSADETYSYHLDAVNRLVMGGTPPDAALCHHPSRAHDPSLWREVENHIRWLWPQLHDLQVVDRWGGPYWATMGLVPALGYVGEDRGAVYGFGSLAQSATTSSLNGEVLAELLLVGYGELARRCPFLNRRMVRWPPNGAAVEGAFRSYRVSQDGVVDGSLSSIS
jgi:glycine/D-amino acid oxidase-like deaminating enzyme